ncbi:uncharacterized protein LOC130974270 [Arachis stenosperma]|uniref:uncharacterized protein LOC130974270 n=1 Tax=Arachis stenosperma TaxID=217475 RepID=UPI0025AB677C|nr:uncharacterized protein LOC130974270 [Arachis stenosperma]
MAKLKSKGSGSRRTKKDLSKVTCFNCKEMGHFKSDCPKLKKEEKPKKVKKKGLMATWEDLENDSDDDDEESETKSQHCLMQNFILKAENDFLKEKLREAETACDLVEENKLLKAQVRSCESDHSVLAYVNCFKQNEELLKEVERLKDDLAKFTQNNDSDGEGAETSKENPKSVQNEESASPVLSRQIEGETPDLSPEQGRETETVRQSEVHQSSTPVRKPREWKSMRGYPHDFIIGDPS